jgi:L-seryl-tRNA(Ser) seleniumtransferase
VDALLRTPAAREAARTWGRPVVRQAIRETLDAVRTGIAKKPAEVPSDEELLARALHVAAGAALGVQPVINATGVLLHTGLGRAPLAAEAIKSVGKVAGRYADLEVDRRTGKRGRRTDRAELLLRAITGAEDALVVNNNAAALVLSLAALAKGKQVLVSRGELIEIGGEFRLPDIMAASGAKLVEVGTTNRTRRTDYERALTDRTALILKVHPSNYQVRGFTQSVETAALAELARRHGIPLVYDLGSGLLARTAAIPPEEPAVEETLAAGADLACFSGDKLLGGPQAGILVGRTEIVSRLRKHPLARALRVDVMTVAALEATLRLWATGRESAIPLWRAAGASRRQLRARARVLIDSLPGGTVVNTEAALGGGSLPGFALESAGVRIPVARPPVVAAMLRAGRPAVFCRTEEDAVVFDLRAVAPEEDRDLRRAIEYALRQLP